MSDYELYRMQYEVTAWKDGCVFATRPVKEGWFDMDDVDRPNTYETNLMYGTPLAPVTDEENRGIRRKVKES